MESLSSKKAARIKTFECPNCGAAIKVHAAGFTVGAACPACGSIVDVNHPNVLLIQKVESKFRNLPTSYIPLNTRGTLKGVQWEVIGTLVRTDSSGQYSWTEYLLYSPYDGFSWLVENTGHWSFVRMIKERPWGAQNPTGVRSISYKNDSYKLFNRGPIKVRAVFGEFYWRIRVGDITQSADFIAPPHMLSYEGDKTETVWSLGQYVDTYEVKKAFPDVKKWPTPIGVGANQPTLASGNMMKMMKHLGLFVAVAIFLQMVHMARFNSVEILNFRGTYNQSNPSTAKQTPSFEFPAEGKNLELELYAPVHNTWFEIGANLIDESDGALAEDLGVGVEYYSGYDSDGSWSEGNRTASIKTSDIDPGKYHLNLAEIVPTYSEPYVNTYAAMDYSITVKRDTPSYGNFFWAMFFLAGFPLMIGFLSRSSEVSRWSNSDFSPYDTE